MGKLKYFLGIEVEQSRNGITISQRKYALDILKETGMLDCRPIDSPWIQIIKRYFAGIMLLSLHVFYVLAYKQQFFIGLKGNYFLREQSFWNAW